jgi:hypothetical protein
LSFFFSNTTSLIPLVNLIIVSNPIFATFD